MTRERYLMGLITDTHGVFRPEIARAFEGIDLILHAGDVGGGTVLGSLSKIAPVEAVYGNVDDPHDSALAGERALQIGGLTVHVSHGHEFGRPTPELLLARHSGDILVFGHTHRALVVSLDAAAPAVRQGTAGPALHRGRRGARRIVVNPGAAGPRRFKLEPSVARLTIVAGEAQIEIISLA